MATIPTTTRQWVLAKYPQQQPINVFDTFKLVEVPLQNPEHPHNKERTEVPFASGGVDIGGRAEVEIPGGESVEPEGKKENKGSIQHVNAAGKIIVRTLWFSNDPAQRTWIVDVPAERRYYTKPVRPGEVMPATAIGEIIESNHPDYKRGDLVRGFFGWTEYAVVDVDNSPALSLMKIPPKTNPEDFMALGLTALTAYFGLFRIGAATLKDQTIVVSSAAGATGSIVCQLAKNILRIPRVIGIVGSDEKCDIIKHKCGVDVALNYRDERFEEKLVEATPELVDVYFDNVGGEVLDAVLKRMGKGGRVVVCGATSTYDDSGGKAVGIESWKQIIFMQLRIEGFVVTQFANEFEKSSAELAEWVKQGKLHPLKTVWRAKFEELPRGMQKLLKGETVGKLVTKIVI
ncbi:quinone oxidoreductase [Rhizina undulata]